MNSPNLFLIGFQKCGSSSLFDFLIQHKEIQGALKKETFSITDKSYEHYNWDNSVMNPSFNWSKYFDFNQNKKYFLEGSVCNFYQETAKEYILNIHNPKVIFLVRNPIDRFSSAFNYYGRSGIYIKPGTSIEDFYTISQNKSSNKEGVNFALDHGRYLTFIEEWRRLLGDQAVLVLSMKEVISNPEVCAEKLSKFLEIDNDFPSTMSHKNKSLVVKNKRLHLLLRKIANIVGLKNKWLVNKYRNLSRKTPEKLILTPDFRVKLEKYYHEEFQKMSNYF